MKTEDQVNSVSGGNDSVPVEKKKSDLNKKANSDSKINRVLRSAGYYFLFFLLGALVVGLVLYLPVNSKLKTAEAELERLLPIESEFTELQLDYEKTSAEREVYKLLSNASLLHVALVDDNRSRINQYVGYIEDDLSDLSLSDFPDLPSSLIDQFAKVSQKVGSNRLGALDELQDFQNDLLLLIDNLE